MHTAAAFFLTIVKSQKAKAHHPLAFSTLARAFEMSKDITIPASFIGMHTMKGSARRVDSASLFDRCTLSKPSIPTLFENEQAVFEQIDPFTKSQSEDVRHLFATVLLLFPNKESLQNLLYLAFYEYRDHVYRASLDGTFNFPPFERNSDTSNICDSLSQRLPPI
jgi:hypothetical protein